jgi:hypothetical protein
MYEKAYRLAREAQAKARAEYQARLQAIGLSPLPDNHYSGGSLNERPYRPQTNDAWELHRQLLTTEGALSDEAQAEIEWQLCAIAIRCKASEILEILSDTDRIPSAVAGCDPVSKHYLQTVRGLKELKLLAMQALGEANRPEYRTLYAEVSREKHFADRSTASLFAQWPMD